jgi:hypothetical protein
MKKFDFYQILFGILLSAIALYFLLRSSASQSTPLSSIPTMQIGNFVWDQMEMTIGDVKTFAVATGFVSAAEKKGGGLSYEAGFVQKSGWTWKTPYGVSAGDLEPAVHLNQKEAESICRYYGKRLPTDAEWTSAAFVEQRPNPSAGFVKGQRYPFPGGSTLTVSHCLSGCGDYKGLAPAGALNRGTGHVTTKTTKPGVNGMYDMGVMFGSGRLLNAMGDTLLEVPPGGMVLSVNKSLMWNQSLATSLWFTLDFGVLPTP